MVAPLHWHCLFCFADITTEESGKMDKGRHPPRDLPKASYKNRCCIL